MAKFSVGETKIKKLHVNKGGTKSLIRKLKVVKDGVTTIPYALPEVTFSSSLLSNTTKKDVLMGDTYGTFPTLTANSNRVDFWFTTDAVAKNDSNKKYIDYPWCAYADANSSLYNSYQYKEDLLAKHWATTGSTSSSYKLGSLDNTTICTKTDNHTVQHAYSVKAVTLTYSSRAESDYSSQVFCEIYYSDNTLVTQLKMSGSGGTITVYPGMQLKLYARYLGDSRVNAAATVQIDGTTKVSLSGKYGSSLVGSTTYTIPRNVQSITVAGTYNNRRDIVNSGLMPDYATGEDLSVTVTTKTL